MAHFAQKLSELSETLRQVVAVDYGQIAEAIRYSADKPALAVGSGGSAVAAAYFERCRETLFGASTKTITPMELTVGATELHDTDVWLFSASADNSDFRAAYHAARVRRARHINIVTRRTDAVEALATASFPNVSAHVVPVANQKDGFLATHSLVSSVSAMLIASNLASRDPVANLDEIFRVAALAELEDSRRSDVAKLFSGLEPENTILVIADPQVSPIASLVETSAWEAAICAVQVTDFRNFAHGRHSWLHHRPHKTLVLALTGHDTGDIWEQTRSVLPSEVRQISLDFGNCGRFRNAVGIIQGLVWIEAMGRSIGIDPGRPGIGDFGRALYREISIERLVERLGPATRQKRRAKLERDDPASDNVEIHVADKRRRVRLASASVGGIVFDYDGTMIPADRREASPTDELVGELKRLHDLGVRLAVATGRGGSAGEKLREVLPAAMQPHFTIGYYNGGYIRQLDVDIRKEPPPIAPAIAQTVGWLARKRELFHEPVTGRNSRVQITLQLNNIRDLETFNNEVSNCQSVASGAIRITQSDHGIDLIPRGTSKSRVAERLAEGLGAGLVVLRIGDQGSRTGNDNELLTHPYGVSVDEVCGRDDGCWSLFGAELTGPDALLPLLMSLKPDFYGKVRMDIGALLLDNSQTLSTNREHGGS